MFLASDYDGTLFHGSISEADIEQINRFRAEGHYFGIVTGRSLDSINDEVKNRKIPVDFIIGNNGGAIQNHLNETLLLKTIDFSIIPQIIETIMEFDPIYYGINDGYRVARVLRKQFDHPNPCATYVSIEEILENKVVSALFAGFNDRLIARLCTEHLNEKFNGLITAYPNKGGLDICAYGINKKSGVDYIANYLNFKSRIHVIGDSFNDVPMIEGFGGFAMLNGDEEVKQLASNVFASVNDALIYVMKSDVTE